MYTKYNDLNFLIHCFYSITRSCLTLWPHELKHSRLPYPLPTPEAYSNLCPSSQWCHPTISSSIVPFSCLQSFPAAGSFPVSSSHQVAKVLELQHQSLQWIFRVYLLKFDWLDPLAVQGILRVFSSSTVQKHQFFSTQPSLWPNSQNCTDYWKNHSFDYMAEIQKICMEMDVKGVV